MKRDMDAVRQILLATEALGHDQQLDRLDGMDTDTFVHHVLLMQDGGLIDARAMAGSGSMANFAHVLRLTWAGHDFLDAARSDTLWQKAKTEVMRPGLSFTFDLVKDWLKTEIAQGFPSLRGV